MVPNRATHYWSNGQFLAVCKQSASEVYCKPNTSLLLYCTPWLIEVSRQHEHSMNLHKDA